MQTKSFLSVFLLLISLSSTNAQSYLSYEGGFNVGLASFQTDYGERGDFQSGVTGNMGMAVGGIFYVNFFSGNGLWSDRAEYFSSHFKVKGEVSYMKAKLEHFGKYVDGTGITADKLKAMHGTSSLLNIGATMEYHFKDIQYFSFKRNDVLDPFVGLGLAYNYSKPTVVSDLGDYQTNPSVLIPKYQTDAVYVDPLNTYSMLFSAGTRINAGERGDFILDMRWQYFLSDKIDGISPNDSSNKYNDWLYSLSVGYVYFIN